METILSHNLNSDTDFSTDVATFLQEVNIQETLAANGAKKRCGTPTETILKDAMEAVISKDSLYMNFQAFGKLGYGKDAYYRMLRRGESDWMKIQTETAKKVFDRLTGESGPCPEAHGVFIVDDTPFRRPNSKKTELVCTQFDHANGDYYNGARVSALSFYGNGTLVNVNNVPVTTTDEEKAAVGAKVCPKGSVAQKKRELSTSPLNEVFLVQIGLAMEAGFEADYVVFDSWFCNPKTVAEVKDIGLDAIGMVKTNGNTRYKINGRLLTVSEIYHKYSYRASVSKNENIFFSVKATAHTGDREFEVKLVFCKSYGEEKEFVCLLSTDTELSSDAIVCLYGIRWGDEVVFTELKSPELDIQHANQCLSLDAIFAGLAITALVHLFLTYLNEKEVGQSVLFSFYVAKEGQKDAEILEFALSLIRKSLNLVSASFGLDLDSLKEVVSFGLLRDPSILRKERWILLSPGRTSI